MCGILGKYVNHNSLIDDSAFRNGLNVMSHRGPDSSKVESFDDGKWALRMGHVRLSIIDLSSGGLQPMKSDSSKSCIVFNGEIYNYKEIREELKRKGYSFKTDSDTEVLINCWECWGIDGLTRLKGMFAFVVYDAVLNKLTFVRDGFGIKPLFYVENENGISWASEIHALRQIEKNTSTLNTKTALTYLLTGNYDHTESTFIEDVNSLQPGYFLEYDITNSKIIKKEKWYDLKIDLNPTIGFDEAVERTRALFLESIRFHLRSDVSLGAALSGGIDSSSIVSAIRYLEPDIELNTFSYVARGYSYNEEKWVDIVNEHNNAIPHKFTFGVDDIANDFDELLRYQGEPFASSSIYAIYRTYKEAKSNGVTVTLDGQGADEIFAGYSGYPHATIPSYLSEKGLFSTLGFVNQWSKWAGRSKETAIKILIRELMEASGIHIGKVKTPSYDWIDSQLISNLQIQKGNYKSLLSDETRGRNLSAQLKYASTCNGLPNLLRTGDRSSMRWTVESRVPFLYPDLAEFVLSLPAHYLVPGSGESKHLFRKAMKGIVPDSILTRRDKIGAKTPDREILSKLSSRESFISGVNNSGLVKGDLLLKEFQKGISSSAQYNQLYWRIFNLYEWMNAHNIKEF